MKLDIIIPGNPWPLTPAGGTDNDLMNTEITNEYRRLKRYRDNEYLFRCQYEKVYTDWYSRVSTHKQQQDLAYIIANFAKILTLLCADLQFGEQGEGFNVKCNDDKTQEALNNIIVDNRFNATLYEESGCASSYRGDAVYKIKVENGKVRIYSQPACNWFPLTEQGNVKRVQKHILAWEEYHGEEKYLRKETHEKGRIISEIFDLSEGLIGNKVSFESLGITANNEPIPEVELTGIDDFLIVSHPNWSVDNDICGVDDYEDIDSLVSELAATLSRNALVLMKHTDPNMYGDPNYLENNDDGSYTLTAGGAFFPVSPDANPPGYLTWDGKLEAAEKQIDRLIELLFYVSETSPACFGLDKSSIAESGAALKKRLLRTLAKVNRKKLYSEPAIKDVLEVAMKLDVAYCGGKYTPERPTIDWQDGLPEDPNEVAEYTNSRIQGGTMSQLEAIMLLDKCDQETALKKLEQIQKEKDAALPSWSRTVNGQVPPTQAKDEDDEE